MDDDKEVLIETADAVTVITLNRPDKLNRLSGAMLDGIREGLATAESERSHVTVIKGSGRAFSSGYDLDTDSAGRAAYFSEQDIHLDRARLQRSADFWLSMRKHPTPVIAQVAGYCLAGGTDLMLACDVAVASDDAAIGMPNTRSLGVTMLLPAFVWSVGSMRAKLMAFTGDTISGSKAASWGLVALSFPETELDERVMTLANRISAVPVELLSAAKRALNSTHDAAGFSNIVDAAVEIDAVAHFTTPVRDFWEGARSNGLKAALTARDAGFPGGNFLDSFDARPS